MSLVGNVHPDAELLRFGHSPGPRQQLLHLAGGCAHVAEDWVVPHPLAAQLQQQEAGQAGQAGATAHFSRSIKVSWVRQQQEGGLARCAVCAPLCAAAARASL